MRIFKFAIAIITIFVFAVGSLAASANSQSVSNQTETTVKDPNAEAISRNIEILTKNNNEESRIQAATALGKLGSPSANIALMQAILNDSSYLVRIACLEARSKIFSNEFSGIYRKYAKKNLQGSYYANIEASE